MPRRLLFDIETDGFLEKVTVIHSLVIKDLDSGAVSSYADQLGYSPISAGLDHLASADTFIGHNIIAYDLPVIRKLHPEYTSRLSDDKAEDTLIHARLIWPRDRLRQTDFNLNKQGRLPGKLIGSHALEAFGYRLGIMKGDYSDWCKEQGIDPWSQWRPEMQSYCEQDVAVTHALWNKIAASPYCERAVRVEHRVASIMLQMHLDGFPFDEREAAKLYAAVVQERDELASSLKTLFPPWYEAEGEVWPKRTVRYKNRPHVIEGAPYTKITRVEFNPSSRDHIAGRLIHKYGWKPVDFTDGGKPQVDEKVLSALTYPECAPLSRYMLLQKRAGQLYEGDEGWLRVSRNGVIHGRVNTLGAVTRRATHMAPNIAQVPKVGSYFGAECRALFIPGDGYTQVGADLSGIELRMLGHYMARFDDGAYASAVVNGTSSDGTDVHSLNARALGLDPKGLYVVGGKQMKGRDLAKTFIYAFLYGAGAAKLATILGKSEDEGASIKRDFLAGLPALAKLIKAVEAKAKTGWLNSLDGGRVAVRSQHAALNTLLQSAGAVVAKFWIVEAFDAYRASRWRGGLDFVLRAWVHDELQFSVRPEIADAFGNTTVDAIAVAGTRLALRCPITGEFKQGLNWRDCH